MKANQSITPIAEQLGRHKSTISRELGRNEGRRGYLPKQACEQALSRLQGSRNARRIESWVKREADVLLGLQWSPEQIAGKLPVSHETLYQHVYSDKARGGKSMSMASLSVEVVNYIEQPDAPSTLRLVVHKVHESNLIDLFRHA